MDGCPVLSVHFSLGLAPHIGQRTDKMCPNVSLPGSRPMLFSIVAPSQQEVSGFLGTRSKRAAAAHLNWRQRSHMQ